jgi:hypothetical protein
MKSEPTEYDMLIDDEHTLLQEIDEHKFALIELETELQVIRNKLTFIKQAVPQDALISIYSE